MERVAPYLERYANSKMVIKGYASPKGSVKVNARVAAARAKVIKTILINKYRTSAPCTAAESQGVDDMLTKPDWNRIGMCITED